MLKFFEISKRKLNYFQSWISIRNNLSLTVLQNIISQSYLLELHIKLQKVK